MRNPPSKSERGQPQAKPLNPPDSESGDFTDTMAFQRQAAKSQRGKPQPKKLNRRKQRKQRGKNFAENAEFSQIALQRRKEGIPIPNRERLCAFAPLRLSTACPSGQESSRNRAILTDCSAEDSERRVALGFPQKIPLKAGCKPALQLVCSAPDAVSGLQQLVQPRPPMLAFPFSLLQISM
jgi:hypothetical protein